MRGQPCAWEIDFPQGNPGFLTERPAGRFLKLGQPRALQRGGDLVRGPFAALVDALLLEGAILVQQVPAEPHEAQRRPEREGEKGRQEPVGRAEPRAKRLDRRHG